MKCALDEPHANAEAGSDQNVKQKSANIYQSLLETGFIGCGEGLQDLSANYKSLMKVVRIDEKEGVTEVILERPAIFATSPNLPLSEGKIREGRKVSIGSTDIEQVEKILENGYITAERAPMVESELAQLRRTVDALERLIHKKTDNISFILLSRLLYKLVMSAENSNDWNQFKMELSSNQLQLLITQLIKEVEDEVKSE